MVKPSVMYSYNSGMLLTDLSKQNTMKWRKKKKKSMHRSILAGLPEITMPYLQKRNERDWTTLNTHQVRIGLVLMCFCHHCAISDSFYFDVWGSNYLF